MFDEASQKALLEEFFSENRGSLDQIEKHLLQLESSPENSDFLNTVFRNMHTVKGNCRMMGFSRLESLSHSAENLLDSMRSGRVVADQQVSSVLLGVVDLIRIGLDVIETQGVEGEDDFSTEIALIAEFSPAQESPDPEEEGGYDLNLDNGERMEGADITGPQESPPPEVATLPPTPPSGSPTAEGTGSSERLQSIQLTIERLDDLMRMVGEAGSSFNQLRYTIHQKPESVDQALEEMEYQIHQLQDEVLKYRLQPIGRIWESYHRLVRDLAMEMNKKVQLVVVGEDTKVDRNVLLAIKDLLGHLIRNAIDHGIEKPEERIAQGKPALGTLTLFAEQKHGQIIMQLADDGAGIDLERVIMIAVDRGLVSSEKVQELTHEALLQLILLPGFSTAETVSAISGRGTGMDVVKTDVERVGGTISIESKEEEGSRFTLSIPQTTALIPALLVHDGAEQYAIPQVNIIELISYFGREVGENIEGKMHALTVQVRNQLLPMVRLKRLVEIDVLSDSSHDIHAVRSREEVPMVIIQGGDGPYALEVDRIGEPVNLVVKPLGRCFAPISILAGTAILPDGSVSFLLNVSELNKG